MTQFFRAGVGAVLRGPDGRVLAFERSDVHGAWQFPQGGLDDGEEPFAAALREVEEETGIPRSSLTLSGRFSELLAYELPAAARSAKTGRGQVQYWFRFDLADSLRVDLPPVGEFRGWRWVALETLLEEVVDFRRRIYERLSRDEQWETIPERSPD